MANSSHPDAEARSHTVKDQASNKMDSHIQPDSAEAVSATLALLADVHKAQCERAVEYRLLQSAFSQYLEDGNEATYR